MLEWPEKRPIDWEQVHRSRVMEELNDVALGGVEMMQKIPPYAVVMAFDHMLSAPIYAMGMRHRIVSRREQMPFLIMPLQVHVLRVEEGNLLNRLYAGIPNGAPQLGSTPIFCDTPSHEILKSIIPVFTVITSSYAIGTFAHGEADIFTVNPQNTEEFYYF